MRKLDYENKLGPGRTRPVREKIKRKLARKRAKRRDLEG